MLHVREKKKANIIKKGKEERERECYISDVYSLFQWNGKKEKKK